VKFRQIIEDSLAVTSALEWKVRSLLSLCGKDRVACSNGMDSVVVRRLLRRAPRWKHGHQILRAIAEDQGDQELVALCVEVLRRL
jgi:hypothetical protein